MKIKKVAWVDEFIGEQIFTLEPSNVEDSFVQIAQRIDGENYDSTCFGIMVGHTDKNDKYDICDLFYTLLNGDRIYRGYTFTPSERRQAIKTCKKWFKNNK